MKDNFREDELLYEVLGETDARSLRTDSLDQMLAALRQRRRGRRKRLEGLLVALCLLGAVGLLMRLTTAHNAAVLKRPGSLIIHSDPLPPGMIVVTDPTLFRRVTSSTPSVPLVDYLPSRDLFQVIGDDRLLALLGERPAALVLHGSAGDVGAELVFLNPADAHGFQIP